jgi:hypothetical protein
MRHIGRHGLLAEFTGDMGGEEALSTGEMQLRRRAALMSLACEDMEKRAVVNGVETINLTIYGTLSGNLTKAIKTLGLKRGLRGPTLQGRMIKKEQQRLSEARDLVVVDVAEIEEDEI